MPQFTKSFDNGRLLIAIHPAITKRVKNNPKYAPEVKKLLRAVLADWNKRRVTLEDCSSNGAEGKRWMLKHPKFEHTFRVNIVETQLEEETIRTCIFLRPLIPRDE